MGCWWVGGGGGMGGGYTYRGAESIIGEVDNEVKVPL